MKQYELMVIVDPDIGSDAINSKMGDIKKMLTSQKGEVFFEDIWGLRDLAYRIKKRDKGFYAVFNMNLEEDSLNEINSNLKLDNEILRHLLITIPADYKAKNHEDMEKEADLEEAAKKKSTRKQETKKEAETKESVKPKVKEEKKVEKKEEKTEPKEKEEAKPEEPAKEEEKPNLEEVDKKLSSLLDNPDLNF